MRSLLLAAHLLLCGAGVAMAQATDPPRPASAVAGWTRSAGRVFEQSVAASLESGYAMVEDRTGFIWLGTAAGLVRWDGYRDRIYAADPSSPGALPDTYVHALLIDAAGRMWVGTNAGGLVRYAPETDRFVPVPDPQGLVGTEIGTLAERRQGGLWVGGHSGLAWLDPDSGRLTREVLPPAVGPLRSVVTARDGTVWVGSDHGLWARGPGDAAFAAVPLPGDESGAPAVRNLLEDHTGQLWVGTRLHGAFTVAAGSRSARPVPDTGAGDLSHDTVSAAVDAGNGEVWLGTYGAGVVRIAIASGRAVREFHDPSRPSSLLDDAVGTLMRGRDGIVWVGTSHGLSRYDTRYDGVLTLHGGPHSVLRAPGVPAVGVGPDGALWLATGEQGMEIVDPATGAITLLRSDPLHPDTTLPRARVLVLTPTADGGMWLGTQGGLYRAAKDGSGLRRVIIPGRSPSEESWALQADGDTLWVGGPDGLWGLDPSRPGTPVVTHRFDKELGQARVSALTPGAHGELWVGTNGGVFWLDAARTTVHALRTDTRDPEALPNGMVSSLLVDDRQRLWVATFGQGLQVENGRRADGSPRFRRLTTRDGLPHDGVDALLRDARGLLWASTDDGLARIDPATLRVSTLRAAQGAGITVFWTAAAARTAGGELLFGGEGGMVVVDPSRVPLAVAPLPPPVATEAQVGDRALAPGDLVPGREVVVPSSARRVQVEFASLVHADQDRLRYAYRLEGFDGEWIETTAERRLASYTNLPAGRYTLAVRAAARDGVWSTPLRLPLRVEPRWFERADVRAAALLLLAAAMFGMMQLRTAVLRRGKQRLEALVDERTAELARRTQELHRSQKQLEELAYFDALTGLANRRLFNEELRRLIADAQRVGTGFALALIDLDHFKQVNDAHGHDAGDALLQATGRRLNETIRAGDRAVRLGGDEFAVLMRAPGDGDAPLAAACRRIGERLAEPVTAPDGPALTVQASIGVARFPQDADSAESLYKAADAALYGAKRAGRGQWRRAGAD